MYNTLENKTSYEHILKNGIFQWSLNVTKKKQRRSLLEVEACFFLQEFNSKILTSKNFKILELFAFFSVLQ